MQTMMLLGLIGVLGFAAQWLAWRARQPAILFLLLFGLLMGPLLGIIDPDALFGELLFPLVSLAVAVILFEGSLTLKRQELDEIGNVVWRLVSIGALICGLLVTLATHWLIGFGWELSALFGAVMIVTGPTVIVPLLRAVRPNIRVSRTLRWEGIIIDPLGAICTVLVFEWIVVQQQAQASSSHVLVVFLATVGIGVLVGGLMALIFGYSLKHHWIPDYLHNFAAITFVVAAFVLSDSLMHESGLLAVTIMGVLLSNLFSLHTRSILEFKESLTLIFVSALFIILAARIDLGSLQALGWNALIILLFVQLVARPVQVFAATIGTHFSFNERCLLAWIGPRGIVAAAVSALFALRLEQLEVPQAEMLVPLSFTVILGTVLIQSLTSRPLAKWLKVTQSEVTGYMIAGANPVAFAVAEALLRAKADVLICDSNWEQIADARLKGLPTYYGNPLSDHADFHLDIGHLGGMLGLSHDSAVNTATALRYSENFSMQEVFTLATHSEELHSEKHATSDVYKGSVLFSDDATYPYLAGLIDRGYKPSDTTLSETFNFGDYCREHSPRKTLIMFARDPHGKLHWFTSDRRPEPEAGWAIYSLVAPEPIKPRGGDD